MSNDIKFVCPHCNQHLEAPPEILGTAVACPSCNTQIQVPQPAPVSSPAPVPPVITTSPPSPPVITSGVELGGKAGAEKEVHTWSVTVPPQPPTAIQTTKKNVVAIWSLILGILSLITCYVGPLFGIPAIICGHLAKGKVRKSNGQLKGGGMALSGSIMGYVAISAFVILVLSHFGVVNRNRLKQGVQNHTLTEARNLAKTWKTARTHMFSLDSKTVQSAEIQSVMGGYGVKFKLSDSGRSEIRQISAQRPSELAVCIAGRMVTKVSGGNGSQLWDDEGVWTGPAMDQTGKYSIGVGHEFYGFSKDEAEELVREILQEAETSEKQQPVAQSKVLSERKGESLSKLKDQAEQGDPVAQHNLSNCYEAGRGVAQDYTEAVKWCRKAADRGVAPAQFNLGVAYAGGKGVTQDYSEAVKWYRKAADRGLASAQFNLGICYAEGKGVTQDYTEAVKWYRKAADQGLAAAQGGLGKCYAEGKGVTQDYTEAVKWYRKSADQGNAIAQHNLSIRYALGQGVAQDYGEAVKWARKAATQGYATAQFNLGILYANGLGVIKEMKAAYGWFILAAEAGDTQAQEIMPRIEALLSPSEVVEVRNWAKAWKPVAAQPSQ